MPDTSEIREIEDRDVDQVIALWHSAGVARPWNPPERDIAFARRDKHSTILVVEDHGRIIASAMAGEDGHRGWVYYVAVDPNQQRDGLGRRLMQAAEEWLKARGCWKVQLLIRADNEGVKNFYERIGYADTKTVCMQKVLRE
ncbi:MAG: GNAT family acetyltransferase [Pseudomonadota bacterium]